MKRLLVAAAVAVQMALFLLLSVEPGLASSDCATTHRVLSGETLSGIAAQYGVTIPDLAERNGIANPNLIRVGQELCVPIPVLPANKTAAAQAGINLVAEFRLTDETPAAEPSNEWLLMHAQPLGLRYPMALVPGTKEDVPLSILQTGLQVRDSSAAGTPVLWLIPNVPNLTDRLSPTYTLALIGNPAPLLALQFGLTPTQTITDLLTVSDHTGGGFGSSGCRVIRNPVSVLGRSSAAEVQMRVELGAGSGAYIGYTVTDLAYWSSPATLHACDVDVALALQAGQASDGYQLLLAMPRSTGGPTVGEGVDADCDDWEGIGGLFTILRVIWGCPE
ncbi:MAG: LysM domain-containing protein [Caldilineaceae bacterium]